MNPSIIEIEAQLDTLRHCLPSGNKMEEVAVLICKAQNILQDHIEKTYTPDKWVHCYTATASQSAFNLEPVATDSD